MVEARAWGRRLFSTDRVLHDKKVLDVCSVTMWMHLAP